MSKNLAWQGGGGEKHEFLAGCFGWHGFTEITFDGEENHLTAPASDRQYDDSNLTPLQEWEKYAPWGLWSVHNHWV